MENFFYNDIFFNDLLECCNYYEWDTEELNLLPKNFHIKIELTTIAPLVVFDSEWMTERINERRFSENNGDKETTKIMNILDENIDFEKINKLIPKMYYINGKLQIVTKKELLEWV